MKHIEVLKKVFGYDSFRQGQEEIIKAILGGINVVAVLPTGAGKSLCYQLPSLVSGNFSVVISPLIALMKDQVDSLNEKNEIAAFINSTMNIHETETVLQKIQYGKIKLLYLSPEKLANVQLAEKLKNLSPSFLFVDEAHCISEWGHNFRPSYAKIKDFVDFIGIKRVSAFTATATPEVVQDIVNQLGLKNPDIFVKGFERENIHINVLFTKTKKERTLELIRQFGKPAIIYTSSRKRAEEVAEYLVMNKVKCEYYHAGLPAEIRRRIQDDFINDKLKIIAATNAFGMGIDKKDIRLIVHYNTPGSIENYYQEIGRAGRDMKESFAFLLHDDNDINIHNYFLSNSYPTKDIIQKIYNAICDYAQVALGNISDKEISINPDYIRRYSGIDISTGLLHSSLKYLEEAGYISSSSDYISDASIKFIVTPQKLQSFLKRTHNEIVKDICLFMLKKFGKDIFSKRIKFSTNKLSAESGFTVTELKDSFSLMDNSAFAEYIEFDSKDLIRLTQPRLKGEDLRLNYKRINEYYLNGQKKIDKIIDFVYSTECRFRAILNYFGENVESYNCGKCDNCNKQKTFSTVSLDYIKEILIQTFSENANPLTEKDVISFLTGKAIKTDFPGLTNFSTLKNYSADEIKLALSNLVNEKKIIKVEGKKRTFIISKTEIESEIFVDPKMEEEQDNNLELFHKLRELRHSVSKRFLQTPELICPDSILAEISRKKPNNRFELMAVPGFNQRMFNKIGGEILEIIKNNLETSHKVSHPHEMPPNIVETFKLLTKGHTLQEIASLRKLDEAVISMQIETILQYSPETDIKHLFNAADLYRINDEIAKGYKDLKELKNRLEEKISFALLRIAVAKEKYSKL